MYSPTPHKHLKMTALVLIIVWGSVTFAQKRELKCKEDIKEASTCSMKPATVTEAAADIMKACSEAQKSDLTIIQAKALLKLRILNMNFPTIAENESLIAAHKKSISSAEEMVKTLTYKFENYDKLRAAYLAKYTPMENRRDEIAARLSGDKPLADSERNTLYQEWLELTNKMNQLYYASESVPEPKESYQDQLTHKKAFLKATMATIADLQAKTDELKNTPEEKRDALLVENAKPLLKNKADAARAMINYKECGFTDLELVAIKYYTASGYIPINRALRGVEGPPSEELQSVIDALNSALDKIGNTTELVKRGATLPAAAVSEHCLGCIVTYPAFTSTSVGPGFGLSHQFIINSKSGKYIAPVSSVAFEEEVLFKSKSKFKVINIEGNKFTLEEVE